MGRGWTTHLECLYPKFIKMFWTIVFAILFVMYGIPLVLGILGGLASIAEENSTGCIRFIVIAIIICALIF